MFALNIMRKTRYDEVTAYWWTGSTDEFRGNNYTDLLSASHTFANFIRGPCPPVGGHLVIARFSHYIQREHSITPLSRNHV